ncbi:hypothetical protein OPV22_009710 [Ensete ventricosum]|uniref:Uncharacterized protein n=1 Tax=Ensete ventricosum TaxID=4639 RepID=A0AAV8RGI6_ENSVE|nr:hypothetical protein OPV22_009710 [Ensete ventricosum]RWV85358.1 hypothetical protein GW17_00052860 [Ensete ventricosum]RWW37290.1 hypothetical protein BHE74_00057625 [Ensete ventricosum]RZS27931.1 hypothetical protein BHM03_00061474 [Ensete ventricosum]
MDVEANLASPPPSSFLGHRFTPAELAAAEQLVQLSGNLTSSPSSSSSLGSVGTKRKTPSAAEIEDEVEEMGRRPRRRRWRYRLVADLYTATDQMDVGGKRNDYLQRR